MAVYILSAAKWQYHSMGLKFYETQDATFVFGNISANVSGTRDDVAKPLTFSFGCNDSGRRFVYLLSIFQSLCPVTSETRSMVRPASKRRLVASWRRSWKCRSWIFRSRQARRKAVPTDLWWWGNTRPNPPVTILCSSKTSHAS